MTVVLDSWALVALLQDEPAAAEVERLTADVIPIISWVNLGEVAYLRTRVVGREAAERTVRDLASSAVRAEIPDEALVLAAARWKAGGGMSYADAFAAATAERHDAPLLTGDPELIALRPEIDVVDLRG